VLLFATSFDFVLDQNAMIKAFGANFKKTESPKQKSRASIQSASKSG
jgi:hypothetical protein